MSGESSYYNYMMRQERAGRASPVNPDHAYFNFCSAVAAVVDAALTQPSNYERAVTALYETARHVSGEGVRSAIERVISGYKRAGRAASEIAIVSRVLDTVERGALEYVRLASAPVAGGSLPPPFAFRPGSFPHQDAFQNQVPSVL